MLNESEQLKFDVEIAGVINALLDRTADENETIAIKTNTSLRKVSKLYLTDCLKLICKYREKNTKMGDYQKTAILKLIEHICLDNCNCLTSEIANFLILFNLDEIYRNLNNSFETQAVVSNILVVLSENFPISVIQSLINKIDSSSSSNSASNLIIIHTLGTLANSNSNANKIMPFMNKILENLISLMALMRNDFSKQILARSFGYFCDCIYEYEENCSSTQSIDLEPISLESLQNSINIGYNILIQSWISTKDLKVVDCVLFAIGYVFPIISIDKVTEQLPKVIPLLLGMNKRLKNLYNLTHSLNAVIKTVFKFNYELLSSYVDNIMYQISDQICLNPDHQTQAEIVRNHNEILRCYEYLALNYFEKIFNSLLNWAKGYEKEKIKMLYITAHLINSIDNEIRPKIDQILNILKLFLTETSLKIKRALIKVIMALASHEYLLDDENKIFIEFLLKMSALKRNEDIPDKKGNSEIVELQKMTEDSLYLLTTTVKSMENFLWRIFLTSFLQNEYFHVSFTILKCLQYLAAKKYEEVQSFKTEILDKHAYDVESPESLMIRCLMLLLKPDTNSENINNILNFLKFYSIFVKCHLYTLWKKALDQLSKNIDENSVLGFLKLTFMDVDENEWAKFVALKIAQQILYFELSLIEKLYLTKLLAVTCASIDDELYVSQNIDLILSIKGYTNFTEVESCSESIGIISRRHCHLVLDKLKHFRSDELTKKSKFFNLNFILIKETRQDFDIDKMRYLIIDTYASIIKSLSINEFEKIENIIEIEIINWIFQELKTTKESIIRKVAMNSIRTIITTISTKDSFKISQSLQKEIIFFLLELMQLHSGMEFIELFPIILTSVISLIKVDTNFTSEERCRIINVVFENVYNASSIYCNLTKVNENEISFGSLKLSPIVSDCFDKLDTLVKELLLQCVNPATLDDILTLLEIWMQKRKAEQRLPAMQTLRVTLQCYLDNMKFVYEAPSKFSQTGYIIGKIVPRCSDSNSAIRKVSLQCVDLVMSIAAKFEVCYINNSESIEDVHKKFKQIEEKIESNDAKTLYANICELANVISIHMPVFQLMHFAESLIDSLMDYDSSSSNGCAIVLSMFLKNRGAEFYNSVESLMEKLLAVVEKVPCTQTRNYCSKAISHLVNHHLKLVITILLSQPLPFDQFICDCWMSLSQNNTLMLNVFEFLKHVFVSESLFNDEKKTENIATIKPLSAVCALLEMFRNSSIYESVITQYADFFSLLLIICGSYINLASPIQPQIINKKQPSIKSSNVKKLIPIKIAIDCFNSFLECTQSERISYILCDHNVFSETKQALQLYSKIVQNISRAVCNYQSTQLTEIIKSLNVFANSNYESQRLTVASFFSDAVKYNGNKIDIVIFDMLMKSLIGFQTDSSPLLRLICLFGMQNFYVIKSTLSEKYYSDILNFFLQSLDDQDFCFEEFNTSIPLEALNGLLAIFSEMKQELTISDVRMTIAIRIRSFFTNENRKLRSKSIELFGILAKSFSNYDKLQSFIEQIECNFICLIVHLNEDDPSVINSCKFTLRNISILLKYENVNAFIQNQLSDNSTFVYQDFITDLVKKMSNEMIDQLPLFIMNTLNFMKSPWNKIRLNSTMLLGQFLNNLTEDLVHNLQIDLICKHLIKCLQESDPLIKAEAIQALGNLFKYKIK